MARSARTAPTTAQRAPSRQETLPAASSWRSAQTPPPPASTASSPNPMQQSTPLILYHDHCSWLMQRFLNGPDYLTPPSSSIQTYTASRRITVQARPKVSQNGKCSTSDGAKDTITA